jgi:hypothetical protein
MHALGLWPSTTSIALGGEAHTAQCLERREGTKQKTLTTASHTLQTIVSKHIASFLL